MMFGMYFPTGAMYGNRFRTFRGYEYSSASEAAELVIEYESSGGGGEGSSEDAYAPIKAACYSPVVSPVNTSRIIS